MPKSPASRSRGFHTFGLGIELERNLRAAGYREPRPVQRQTLPAALEGRDILGLAQTGTGKTAAFALPILKKLLSMRPGRGPHALVVAPTRELAVQIDGEFRKLAASTRIRTVILHGGVSERPQIQKLRRGPGVVVACPGRLLDLHRRGHVPLDRVDTLVLDEADHMFDMGFLPDIRRILEALPADRQNMLFGATMPAEIRRLAQRILRDPFVTEISHSAPARTIDHALCPVVESRKMAMLEHFIAQDDFVSAIVFARTRHRAKRLAHRLDRSGHRAVALQGNMSQGQRDRAMSGFRDGRFDILVATDIAARGIDVEQVSHVVNFDIPNTPEAYTHRIGRTGRSERRGRAFTFATASDRTMVREIEREIGRSIRIVKVEGFEISLEAHRGDGSRSSSRKRGSRRRSVADAGPGRGRPRAGSRRGRRRS
jgi:ATP-dependent RNA helicase RhlE